MNKRHGMIAIALAALLLATSCSTFFTGGVSGTVTCNGNPVADATVAVYFDKEVFDEDYSANLDKVNPVFNTDYKVARTAQNGSFSITNIPWDSCFPEYGKDADSVDAYVLVYHKDYGLMKYEETLHVISGRSNEINPKYTEKLTRTEEVSVMFRNPETDKLENGIRSIEISYNGKPGYEKAYEETIAVTGGRADFTIEYKGDEVPSFDITEIKYVTYDGKTAYAAVVGKDAIGKDAEGKNLYAPIADGKILDNKADANGNVILTAIPLVYEFGGFSGSLESGTAAPAMVSIYKADSTGSDPVGNALGSVFTRKTTDRDTEFTSFTGLGNNIVLENVKRAVASTPEKEGYRAVFEDNYIIKVEKDSSTNNKAVISSDPDAITTVAVKN